MPSSDNINYVELLSVSQGRITSPPYLERQYHDFRCWLLYAPLVLTELTQLSDRKTLRNNVIFQNNEIIVTNINIENHSLITICIHFAHWYITSRFTEPRNISPGFPLFSRSPPRSPRQCTGRPENILICCGLVTKIFQPYNFYLESLTAVNINSSRLADNKISSICPNIINTRFVVPETAQ